MNRIVFFASVMFTFCIQNLEAQVVSGRFSQKFDIEAFSDFGIGYSSDRYSEMSEYASVGVRLITNDVYGFHLASGIRYQTTLMKYGTNPAVKDVTLPYVSEHKNVFVPVYLGYVSQRYNYNYYYARVGVEPYISLKNGKVRGFDTDKPLVWGYEIGTKYDFMNHWLVTAQLQHRFVPTVVRGEFYTDQFFGVHLGLVYELTF